MGFGLSNAMTKRCKPLKISKMLKPLFEIKTKNFSLTDQQQKYKKLLNSDNDLVIAIGPAGTGKTWIACKNALEALDSKLVSKILITRPTVTVNNENIGHLPGSLDSKFSPFVQPIYDCFRNEISEHEFQSLLKTKTIEVCPLGFLRGRTFDNTYVIADEMQNAVISQTKMLLSRVGHDSKIVMTGDSSQCDIEHGIVNGLDDLIMRIFDIYSLKSYETIHEIDGIGIVKLGDDDCKRSEFVKKVIKIYNSNQLFN